ncbi:zinc finger translocation-associated protein-like [Pristis pectinata]|uniref:zinc finger translocation-associated protein-like n=1 Tax=Pristis pectinata TaxID=685728 RepID=UPI00223E8E5F|nr:zinc finger translocation-associated protein-like [Pristis pectinata]
MSKMEPGEGEVALSLGLQNLRSDPRQEPTIKEERLELGDDPFVMGGDSEPDKVAPGALPSISTGAGEPEDQRARAMRRPRRDHRRNYQERWRSEYLMDYDRWRHGLVCMVCGATLATLKLSTIKRHILQRHQASLLLTQTEKEVVIASWEKHVLGQNYLQEGLPVPVLSLDPAHPDLAPAAPPPPMDVIHPPPPARDPSPPAFKDVASRPAGRGRPPGKKPKAKAKPPVGRRQGLGCPSAKRVRRYYQERWRSEYLMDYDCLRHGLVCMVCGSALATLKLSTIKRHILQKHQASLSLTPSQKDVVMATWVEHLLNQSQHNIESQGAGLERLHQPHQGSANPFGQSPVESPEPVPASRDQSHVGRPGLIDQSQVEVPEAERSPVGETFRQSRAGVRHKEAGLIHQLLMGESIRLIDQSDIGIEERAGAAQFKPPHFNQSEVEIKKLGAEPNANFLQSHAKLSRTESSQFVNQSQMTVEPRGAGPAPPAGSPVPGPTEPGPVVKAENHPEPQPPSPSPFSPPSPPPPSPPNPEPTPGRGVRRHYQQRWRSEHLMDYDPRRRRLVCMVCGKALATLTLGAIRRHVLQNHPHSLLFNRAEKENILEAWNEQPWRREPGGAPEPPTLSPAGKRPLRRYQERWRSEHLMDYDPWRRRLVCMVCGKALATLTLGAIRRHVLQSHPHSLHFSPAARENILQAWSKTVPWQREEESVPPDPGQVRPSAPSSQHGAAVGPADRELGEPQEERSRSPVEIEVYVEEPEKSPAARRRFPGRDHRRNYQERWRLEYLMDYDQWRHGLVCMVCGATLATLKLSTIKRHILQRHQASLGYTLTQKVLLAQEWNKKVAAIARMDLWRLPSGQSQEGPPRDPGGIAAGGT